MESDKPTIEELITTVLIDIQQKGYSAVQPFNIGEVEQRMMVFAKTNGITLASDQLYVSAKQLQHCMRASKICEFHNSHSCKRPHGVYIAQVY